MSEEIRNPNNEINDAALEGVSGGVSESKLTQAQHICEHCIGHRADLTKCGGGVEQLAEYLSTIPPISYPVNFYSCPFFKR